MAWRSPSNIALVKYWGKKPLQIPANPSLSMTLSKAYTEMVMDFSRENDKGPSALEFYFEGAPNERFATKISAYLQSLSLEYPVIKDYRFRISSRNTFPHSAGIASSASSMSALGLCLTDFLAQVSGAPFDTTEASRLSRLASGSACRSIFGGFALWGRADGVPGSSDQYAIPLPFAPHKEFEGMRDAILVVSSREKDVSSRAGHSLMEGHPYAQQRFRMAGENLQRLLLALQEGDWDTLVEITESEALGLHALMMTSSQSYILFEPNSIAIVNAIRRFRKSTGIPVCFTLDAGPNVHLLYSAAYEGKVKDWISDELVKYCENGKWIDDEMGVGPEKI